MKLVVISSAPILKIGKNIYIYAPYEKEMQIWAKHVASIQFCCPIWKEDRKLLFAPISFKIDDIIELHEFEITTFLNKIKAVPFVFLALIKIFKVMQQADHIHLRCPGNMGLIGTIVQIFFPKKTKTAKYAGNWDPKSNQPWSYRLQKWILSNTVLTKNMKVLVYGEWENQTINIKPFFTATYSESEIQHSKIRIKQKKEHESIKFLFVGTLSKGKQPLYAIQLVEKLYKKGKNVTLDLYGEGAMRDEIDCYIIQNNLHAIVTLKGNQSHKEVLGAYQNSHFLLLPSKSEGWPKVVAEAMFWGCVPIAIPVSCVSYMMGNGSRGIILNEKLNDDLNRILTVINNEKVYLKMALEGQLWSQQYTTNKFETEISKLLKDK